MALESNQQPSGADHRSSGGTGLEVRAPQPDGPTAISVPRRPGRPLTDAKAHQALLWELARSREKAPPLGSEV